MMSTPDTAAEPAGRDESAGDEYEGAPASRTLEIVFAVVALAFTAGYLFLSTQIPLRREAEPSEIASAVVFLLSDDASYVTGQILGVNGGRNT